MNTQQLADIGTQLTKAIEAGEVIDAYQAADLIGLHHNNIFKACADGKIKAVKIFRTWYMTPDAVREWREGMKFTRR